MKCMENSKEKMHFHIGLKGLISEQVARKRSTIRNLVRGTSKLGLRLSCRKQVFKLPCTLTQILFVHQIQFQATMYTISISSFLEQFINFPVLFLDYHAAVGGSVKKYI